MRLPMWAAYPLQTVLLSLCMAIVMSISLTLVRVGLAADWLSMSLRNAMFAFPVALTATFVLSPLIHRLVASVTEQPIDRTARTTKRWDSATEGQQS